MKPIKHYIIICAVLLFSGGCDKDFVEINTNPYAVTAIDPALLFAGSQRPSLGTWGAEHTIVQQYVSPFNAGATKGFNFNADVDDMSNARWNQSYPGEVRSLVQALILLGDDTDRTNLVSMIRIWKAHIFMALVDTYADVPYFEAGRAVNDLIYYPVYDDDEAIYDDLYNEITEGLASLDPGADYVSEDLFYGVNGENATTTPADQVAKWRKLGNSLLLRLGMRYSKFNPTKAEDIVSEAFAGGVMTSNADNAYVKYDGIAYLQTENNNLRNFPEQNYAAEPFVDQLKSTNDPRGKYMIATYDNAAQISNDPDPDTVLVNQVGVPIGVLDIGLTNNPKGGLAYSQMNIYSVVSPAAPNFYITYAQTSLLLAEATVRGWIVGGSTAQTYYEDGIKADMNAYSLYPNTPAITPTEIATYLAEPGVDFTQASTDEERFDLINTQYWVVNFRNGTEAFANFRRSGYPDLVPNDFNDDLDGGFARRLTYPDAEGSSNAENFLDAREAIGGDNLLTRVFWDIE